jgi:U6 snRNA-associated Sm-like protein LSm7
MSNLGLTIRIQKESLIKLSDLQGKQIVVKFSGGREVIGSLKSWDKTMNLILENTQ